MNIQFSAPFFEVATSFAMSIFGISVENHVAVALIAEVQKNTSLYLINYTMSFIHLCATNVMCTCMLFGPGLVSMAQRSVQFPGR